MGNCNFGQTTIKIIMSIFNQFSGTLVVHFILD